MRIRVGDSNDAECKNMARISIEMGDEQPADWFPDPTG